MVIIDKILRSLFGAIDSLFGWAISVLYSLIIQIAHVDVFGDYIYEFMGRIYTFLAIFMVFKLSISVANYVLNPDQLTDKSKGFGKLIQNVVIVIALIMMVPSIFSWAYRLQSIILNTNVLYTIITGHENSSDYNLDNWNNMSDSEKVEKIKTSADGAAAMIKYEIMSTFIYYKDEGTAEEVSARRKDGKSCYEVGEGAAGAFGSSVDPDLARYTMAYECLMDGDTINNTKEKTYGFTKKGFTNEYKFLISTICLGFTAYIFLVFCFDVSLRCVKLGALQLIAPVPIISMLDPNSGKNGMFSKWLKDCTKTYLDMFIRLAGLFFAIEMISGITSSGRVVWRDTTTPVSFGFVKIFIILGCLMFAKQLPQFIEGITGVKMDGGSLNLKKKVGDIPLAGKPINKAAGFAGRTAKNVGLMGGRYLGKGMKAGGKAIDDKLLGGFFGNTGNRIKGGIDRVKNDMATRKANFYSRHPKLDAGLNDARKTFAGVGSDATKTFYDITGGMFNGGKAADAFDDKIKRLEGYKKFKDQILSQADNCDVDIRSLPQFAGSKGADKGVKGLKRYYEDLKDSGTATYDDIEKARKAWEDAQTAFVDGDLTSIIRTAPNNDVAQAALEGAQNIKKQAARYVKDNRDVFVGKEYEPITKDDASLGDIKGGIGRASSEVIKISTSAEYEKAQAVKAAMPPKK